VAVDKVRDFETAFLRFMDASHPEIGKKILETRALDSDTEAALRKAIEEFKRAGAY
jgi:F-type H+-transporting ATPase subunit alpha